LNDNRNASELTGKAIAAGAALGTVVASVNVYMGLKIGWTEGGSILAAILGFVLLRFLAGGLTKVENNIVQTLASASGSLAGVVITVVAAFSLLGRPMNYLEISIYLLAVAFLGVFYAIPLRKQLVEVERLPFPTGTATATTIEALHATGGLAAAQAKSLGIAAAVAGAVTWLRDGVPSLIRANLFPPVGSVLGHSPQQLTLGMNVSPMLLAAGLLVGPRVGVSLLAGSMICWVGIAPALAGRGIIEDVSFRAVTSWTLWPGVGLLVAYGLTAALVRWRVFARGFALVRSTAARDQDEKGISPRFWLIGFTGVAVAGSLAVRLVFEVPLWMAVLAVPLSFVLALVSVRAAGETDINPTGTMGHTTQIVFGGLSPGQPHVNLVAAGMTSAGASQAADLMQDLKAGHLLGSSPLRQVYAQMIGVLTGVLVVVPVFLLISGAYGLGSETIPAPVAMVWSGFARVVAGGGDMLPMHAGVAGGIGVLVGILLAVLDRTNLGRAMPSAVGLGVAMVIPALYCVPIFVGSMCKEVFRRIDRERHDRYAVSVASGGIVGEGLIGVLVAGLKFGSVLG